MSAAQQNTLLPSLVWDTLSDTERSDLLARPPAGVADITKCQEIIDDVRTRGDTALADFTLKFDGVQPDTLKIPAEHLSAALYNLPERQRRALDAAYDNITRFHQAQISSGIRIETAEGVSCEMTYRPINAVGLYVPGGTAPLPSAVLMLGIPSQLANCPQRVLCTPPQADGKIDPLVLAAAARCGISDVFAVGGAHAVAAMAYGSETIPAVDKIFGPGNPWVTRAKQLVAQDPQGATCDLPAGPSEVLVIADEQANPAAISADLLSQAEHGKDSQVILVVTNEQMAIAVRTAIQQQLTQLSRADLASGALMNSRCFVVNSIESAIELSNAYAPEHLILNLQHARSWLPYVNSAGSVFLGRWSPEAIGDYCSGTNHVLPTHGYARTISGIGLKDFQKCVTVQELSCEGLQNIGWIATTLAHAEGLDAHALAVDVRLVDIQTNAGETAAQLSAEAASTKKGTGL